MNYTYHHECLHPISGSGGCPQYPPEENCVLEKRSKVMTQDALWILIFSEADEEMPVLCKPLTSRFRRVEHLFFSQGSTFFQLVLNIALKVLQFLF